MKFLSMHSQMFFKIIANFTGVCCRSLLSWSCRHQKCNFIKKRLQHRISPVEFAKFLRAPCLTEHLQWLLLKVSGFQPATLLKRRLRKRCFSVNFAKFLGTYFLLTGLLFVFFRTVFWACFIEHLKETAILCKSCRISTTRYSKKLFHRCFSNILY